MTATQSIDRAPLPHEPEPVREMLRRLQGALEPVIDMDHPIDDAPGFHRLHVFDFANGVRLIITREIYGWKRKRNIERVHLSFGIIKEFQKFWPSKDAFVAHCGMTANLLGFCTGGEDTEILLTDRALHVFIPLEFCRLSPAVPQDAQGRAGQFIHPTPT